MHWLLVTQHVACYVVDLQGQRFNGTIHLVPNAKPFVASCAERVDHNHHRMPRAQSTAAKLMRLLPVCFVTPMYAIKSVLG